MDVCTIPLFSGIEASIVESIISKAKKEVYQSGDVIILQGEKPDGKAYIIELGDVQIEINGAVKKVLHQGDVFGEIALLNEEARTATVKAMSDITVIILSYEDMMQMLENDQNIINKEVIARIEENFKSQYSFSREA